jgi:hypothetical protein
MDRETADEIKCHFNVVAEGLKRPTSPPSAPASKSSRPDWALELTLVGLRTHLALLKPVIPSDSEGSRTRQASRQSVPSPAFFRRCAENRTD